MVASDHRSVVAYLEDKINRRKRQFRFDKRWIGQEGLMESITMGWIDYNERRAEGRTQNIVEKISNCRHEIAKWRKDNPPYGKEKINELQKVFEEVQTDILGLTRIFWRYLENYKMHIRMRKSTGTRKVKICGIHLEILIQNFIML